MSGPYIPTDEEANALLRAAGMDSTPESRVAAKLVGGIVIERFMGDLAERIWDKILNDDTQIARSVRTKLSLTPALPSSETGSDRTSSIALQGAL